MELTVTGQFRPYPGQSKRLAGNWLSIRINCKVAR